MSVVLVTGASSGIGAAVAIAFAEAGWDVLAAGRDEGRLDELADAADNIVTWAGELESSDDCEELVADTLDEFGRIDCLVNSAGVYLPGNAVETDDESWRDTLFINLDVPFYLSRAAVPHLAENGGAIINIACAGGIRPEPRSVAYAVSKGGLILLSKAMARDHGADGIRVNAICPGNVDTPMLAGMAEEAGESLDAFLDRAAARSPTGKISSPEDVAETALFLAGEGARQVNGAVIAVDGGLLA